VEIIIPVTSRKLDMFRANLNSTRLTIYSPQRKIITGKIIEEYPKVELIKKYEAYAPNIPNQL
jgi:hypothetical protein